MNTNALITLLDTDFCPWANRYVYWFKTPLGILVLAAVASLICGLLVAPQGLVISATIFVTIVLGMVWPWVGLRGVSCELQFADRRCTEGQRAQVEVIVRNSWPFPVWGLGIEEGFFLPQEGRDSTALSLSGIRGWSKAKFCWDFEPERRGVYPTSNAKIATEFPFGIWKARREIATTGRLVVWPRAVALQTATLPDRSSRSLLRANDKQTGNEGDRIGVRAYRQGDSLRFVHWAQTAKCGRLIVSERQGPAQSSAVIAIDTDPVIHAHEDSELLLDSLLRIAASICDQLTSQNVSVQIVANDESWKVHAGDMSRHDSLDRLASLSAIRRINPSTLAHANVRFVVTASQQMQFKGSDWKEIVLTNSVQANAQEDKGRPYDAWIEVDSVGDPLSQFARLWRRNVCRGWRGSDRKLEVA